MAIVGICASCGQSAIGLFTCRACGSRVCPQCIIPASSFCKICQGRKMVK